MEVLDCIRQRVGDHFVLGIRIQIDECFEGGYGLDEGITICNALTADKMVDFLNLNSGEVATYVYTLKYSLCIFMCFCLSMTVKLVRFNPIGRV